MQLKEIHQHFGEIQHVMAELFKTYETPKPASNTAENTTVTTLRTFHEGFHNALLLSPPQTDAALNTVVGAMRCYLLVTQPQVDDLKKLAKSAKSEPSDILQKRNEVQAWCDTTAALLTAAPAAAPNAMSSVPTSPTNVEAISVPSPASTPTPTMKNELAVVPNANSTPTPDNNLLVDLLIGLNPPVDSAVITQTKQLFNGIIDPSVTDQTIPALVTSWQSAVNSFVLQFKKVPAGNLMVMTGLIELHALLESLYDQLLPNITQTSGDSLDNRILSIY